MTREEAIMWLIKPTITSTEISVSKAKELEAYDMAIEALKGGDAEILNEDFRPKYMQPGPNGADLISRELAMERIANDNVTGGMERINEYNNSTEFNDYLDGISDAITTIFCDVPSAEAVSRRDTVTLNSPISIQAEMVAVVRCKDCRHRDLFSCPLTDNDFQKDDDFCSWGERKGGEDE